MWYCYALKHIHIQKYLQTKLFYVSDSFKNIQECKRVQKYRKHKMGHDYHSNGIESSQKFFTLFCLVLNTEYEKHEIFHKRDSFKH